MADKTIHVAATNVSTIYLEAEASYTLTPQNPLSSISSLSTNVQGTLIRYKPTTEGVSSIDENLTYQTPSDPFEHSQRNTACTRTGLYQAGDDEYATFQINDPNVKKVISGKITAETISENSLLSKSVPRDLTTEECLSLTANHPIEARYSISVGWSDEPSLVQKITYNCYNVNWVLSRVENIHEIGSTGQQVTKTINGEAYLCDEINCSCTCVLTGSSNSLSAQSIRNSKEGSCTFTNPRLELLVEYEDAPIKISATPNSSTQSSDTPITFSVSSTDSTKTLKDCYFTASFTHERNGVSKVFHSEPEFKVSNLNQIYPYIQGSGNYNGAIQNLFLYIPDIWERNTANEIIFAEGDIYTVTLTATRYTIDDTVITNPVTANFVYTIGSVTKLTLNSINSTLTNTSSVANDALLEFSLYGTLGTYAVETISWTGELQKADGTKVCTLEYSGYEKTSIETGTNVKLGTGKYRIPSDYRSQVLSGGPYKIYITATATTYDNTIVGPIDNTFENWVFVPSEYTLSLKSGLNEGQEVYAGQEITSLFALSKTGADQAETGVQYTFKIKINNTNYLEITTFDTAYTWYCDDILGPVTYEISCEANIGGQGPQTETVNCTTYARLMQSSAIVTDKNEYYNTESTIITSKITIPAPALTKEVILSVKDKEELTRYTIPVQDSSYTASQLKFTLNLARELYLKYRGPIQITLAAIARDGVNSAYVKTEYSTISKTIYIINSAGKFIYPVEGATTVIPHPDFMIQSEKGTFATGYGFVSLGDGKWIRVTLEADAKDNTKYRFKQPYVIANNTDYTLQFKETLELDKYPEIPSSQTAVSWKTNFVDLNFVTEDNYRLLEKYNYRKYLINLLNWYGALSNDLNNIEKTTNKSQLSKLIDVVTTLFGDKQVYSTIATALEKYGNDSPQTWNAFIAAQLYNARQYKN